MPKFQKKSNNFNLIGREVTMRKSLRNEKNWYSSFNFLVVIVITAFAGLAYAFSIFNTSSLQGQKENNASYANSNVNVDDKIELDRKIKILNDKFTLYQIVKNQGFEATSFYEELSTTYRSAKINRISFRPGTAVIEVQVAIPLNAYEELPKFLSAVYSKYDNVEVSKVSFDSSTSGGNALSNSTASASLTLNFSRELQENALIE